MTNTQVDIADLVVVELGPTNDVKSYFRMLAVAILNQTYTVKFRTLTIDKVDARKIYKRAYPKAKV